MFWKMLYETAIVLSKLVPSATTSFEQKPFMICFFNCTFKSFSSLILQWKQYIMFYITQS